VITYVAGIGAARQLGPKLASFTGLAEVLFAVLFAWLLLNQLPSGIQLLGGAFIITGVALVRVDELRGTGPSRLARPGRAYDRPRSARTRPRSDARIGR
jgi:drug/metabolite transporter (DMT)-like permease